MNKNKHNLRNHLRSDTERHQAESNESDSGFTFSFFNSRFIKVVLLVGFLFAFFHSAERNNWFSLPFASSSITNQPSESLLDGMNDMMVDMGYLNLDNDDLRNLRKDGITATYISNVRALGFSELSLDDATKLAKANVNSRFIAMMQELGYDLDVDELVELRRAGVTAHLTSNIHDLGYTDVSKEQLIRIRRIGVTPEIIKKLQSERGDNITMEEIIRYTISNQ